MARTWTVCVSIRGTTQRRTLSQETLATVLRWTANDVRDVPYAYASVYDGPNQVAELRNGWDGTPDFTQAYGIEIERK